MLCHIITEPICIRTRSLDAFFPTNYLLPTHSSLLPDTLTCLIASFYMLLPPGFWFSSLSYAAYYFLSEVRGLTELCLPGFLCSTKHLPYVASWEEVRRNSWSWLLVLSWIVVFFFFPPLLSVCVCVMCMHILLVLQAVQALPSRALCEITPVCWFSFFCLCVSVYLPVSLLPLAIRVNPPPQYARTYSEAGLASVNLKTCGIKMHVLPWDALGSGCLKSRQAA